MQILGLSGIYFETVIVFVTKFSLLIQLSSYQTVYCNFMVLFCEKLCLYGYILGTVIYSRHTMVQAVLAPLRAMLRAKFCGYGYEVLHFWNFLDFISGVAKKDSKILTTLSEQLISFDFKNADSVKELGRQRYIIRLWF